MAFCKKLNSLYEGKLPQGYRFDLPTEAQWEYAARGGAEGVKRARAYRYSGGDDVTQVAWCKTTSGNKPHKVGELRPNELGIYDMNGNLWEWCSDVFKMNFSTKPVVDSEEGGVFGHLGYPVSDEEIYSGDGDVKDRVSHFEHGDIVWKAKENRIHVGRTITLYGNTKMELVWCPPGEFMMGSPESEEGRYDGETQHRVRLTKGFWLGKYPVTQRQWQSVMGSTPSEFKGDDLPVETVSWDDCQAFIKKVNAALECGARLPTEAEWEYACRAGTTTAYSWGNALNGDRANCDGNYPCGTAKKGPYLEKTTPVGKYGANPWGLCDMHGNVWEWCADWRGDYPSGSVVDPTGPASGGNRVLRGGDWSSCARDCRSAIRNCNLPDSRDRGYGFRLCCSAGPRG